jgi:hypothetical protein
MELTISVTRNNWTPEGPDSTCANVSLGRDGFTSGGRGSLTVGSYRVRQDYPYFVGLLDKARQAIADLQVNGTQRLNVSVTGRTERNHYIFFSLGATSPRDVRRDVNNPRTSRLALLVIAYITGDTGLLPILHDYIADKVYPTLAA